MQALEFAAHVALHAVEDTVHLVPVLFATYVAMEALEHAAGEKIEAVVARGGRLGALAGAVLGVVPQCGFSAVAATLYSARVASLGTLVAVFLSTSDELVPIFLAEGAPVSRLASILLAKVAIAAVTGLAVDAAARALGRAGDGREHIHDLCEREQCDCEHESAVVSALKHTATVTLFIFLVTFVLDGAIELVGEGALAALLAGNDVLAVIAAGVLGLVPNCAASVLITQLYLSGVLGAGAMLSGLLVSSGVGFLVLFRTNPRAWENLGIQALLLASGIAWGLAASAAGVSF